LSAKVIKDRAFEVIDRESSNSDKATHRYDIDTNRVSGGG